MTNFVKIHCMTEEKLAEFLSKVDTYGEGGPWWKWFDDTKCKACEEKANKEGCDVPCEGLCECIHDDTDEAVILEWLRAEYREGDSREAEGTA